MFRSLNSNPRALQTVVAVSVVALAWFALVALRGPAAVSQHSGESTGAPLASSALADSSRTLTGEQARVYLEQTSEGQSLMKALEEERFGLKWQEQAPSVESGSGYLGMSHDENLNAWFAEEGVTIRPTVAENERNQAWRLDMRLKAYGYGRQLLPAPPVVRREVKGSRIEYLRDDCEWRMANCGIQRDALFNSKSEIQNPKFVEWYMNKSAGIEQGFTLAERPVRNSSVIETEPLRLIVSVSGDLHARATADGQSVELSKSSGESVLSYDQLVALDAHGQRLAARMETNTSGDEIALIVEDAAAQYPIVVDPITATIDKRIDAGSSRQTGARFGFAVAIDGDTAVVGAWREDNVGPDNGSVYTFKRPDFTSTAWSIATVFGLSVPNSQCGYSVAIDYDRVVLGCPGANNSAGRAFYLEIDSTELVEIMPGAGAQNAGNLFGTSVAFDGDYAVIGSSSYDTNNGGGGPANVGLAQVFRIAADGSATMAASLFPQTENRIANAQFGTDVAIEGNTIIGGAPGAGVGYAEVWELDAFSAHFVTTLRPGDGLSGDQFGQSVAVDGNTAVVGAQLEDNERGTDAGAAYVFVSDNNQQWSQQQKLTASDGRASDFFSSSAVAIEGNTLVIGAFGNGNPINVSTDDDRGAAYLFTRSGTVWTQQAKLTPSNFAGGEPAAHFGIGVDISYNALIIGARAASAGEILEAGAAYMYRPNCTAPTDSIAFYYLDTLTRLYSKTVCPGQSFEILGQTSNPTGTALSYQWRKDGVNIPGANTCCYTIANASAADVGNYDVIITNACGSELSAPFAFSVHSFSLNPASQNFAAAGSNSIVNVMSTGNCNWTATSNAAWINITSGASGTGNGTVGFTVAANTGTSQRTGNMSIAGQTFNVTQDGAPSLSSVQFSAVSYNVDEGAGFATLTVTRSGDLSGTATVDYATGDIGAQQRTDYTISAGQATFAAAETSKSFSVLIVDDVYVEGNEALNVSLSNPTGGAVLGSAVTATLTINDNDSASATTNPLDNARFFTQQHYYDFLSRFPDSGGWDFWTNRITSCGTDPVCLRNRRIEVSNSFFYELEYQQTGAYVFRLYRAAFGNNQPFPNPDNSNQTESKKLPGYTMFAFDRARVVGGANLAAGQQSIANAFVLRSEFLAKYPSSQTGPAFVDALLATVGNDLGVNLASQRTALINLFNSGGRGAVLYRLADDNAQTNPINNRALIDAEYNRAFVATQYFGYLRRDADIGGFLFWLAQVNSAPLKDTAKQQAMVCAFITAAEYQQRLSAVVTHTNAECSP